MFKPPIAATQATTAVNVAALNNASPSFHFREAEGTQSVIRQAITGLSMSTGPTRHTVFVAGSLALIAQKAISALLTATIFGLWEIR